MLTGLEWHRYNMNTLLVLTTTLAVVSADVSLGYHYKVPETSYGVPSYQFGESASHGISSGLSGSIGSSSGFGFKTPGSSLGLHGSSSHLTSGLYNGGISGLNNKWNSGQYYPSISSGSGSLSSYYPSISGSGLSGSYYPSSLGSGSSTGGVIDSLGGDISQSLSNSQYLNNYQNAAASKYQQFYVQQQPAQVYKHFYVHAAPEEPEEAKPRQPIVLPPPQKHYKIIFVKTPTQQARAPQVVAVPQQNEEKTIVYVLSKKPEEQSEIIVPKIEQKPPSKPEVYFIKYKNKEDSQAVISDIVNDYNNGQSQVSFSGINNGALGESSSPSSFGSSSQSLFGSGTPSSFGSGVQSTFGSGSQSSFGSGTPSAFGSGVQRPFGSGSQSSFGSGTQSSFGSGSGFFGSGSQGALGSLSVPSSASQTLFSEQLSDGPIEIPVGGFGSNSFDVGQASSGPQSIGFGSTESSILSSVPSIALSSVPESSTSASAIASGGQVSSTASSISYDDSNLISTSQGVPHETYGPPKFRVNN